MTTSQTRFPRRVAIAVALGLTTLSLTAYGAFAQYGGSSVRFTAKGPGGLNINGRGSGVTVSEKGGNLVVVSRVDNLKTGISLRDSHLKKYIHADKHSTATLTVARSKLKLPADGAEVSASASGTFKLNGVNKATTFTYSAKRKNNKYVVRGYATVNINDHKIETPCYLGVCVDPKVSVKVAFKVEDK